MQLIQRLLPLNSDDATSREGINEVRKELTTRFGGLTLYRNAPAEGLWEESGRVQEDAMVVVAEVMADELDRDWWSKYRGELERRFQQVEIVIRAISATRLLSGLPKQAVAQFFRSNGEAPDRSHDECCVAWEQTTSLKPNRCNEGGPLLAQQEKTLDLAVMDIIAEHRVGAAGTLIRLIKGFPAQ